ncbi:MAG: protoporphyrinogen oxidase HemJ [Porticoccaceae bacterium]|nr:protoporphyrinogen oxidase HemJ [Porticoccaceae bacterium]MBT3798414.1 protoporphyrinogen oxidase HemJ [Porticoccaceae bacterium]MBT4164257.1 protoporphyrinogen oxidase HemJ [Porticoccaceae bacterium]MBT4212184.1 protoporphyrinogen oxidase HemJ [Porticoccaceae bacterium]MBT4590574.1 protoporphyrinogen oxidase HemJ [Porticoccaceae bacterium]
MYKWVLAFHVIAVICWFAALFYLPRLFVYHAMSEDEISIERFKVMQRKLYRGIANPAMIATIVLGLWLVSMAPDAYLSQTWFQLKVGLVLLLIGYHYMCLCHMKKLADNRSDKSHVYFRVFNEVPVLFLVAIVILVIVQPF